MDELKRQSHVPPGALTGRPVYAPVDHGGVAAADLEWLDATEASDEQGGGGLNLWRLLDYKWSILGVFVLVAAAGVGGVFTVLVPEYTATARIEVSPVIPQLIEGTSDMVPLYESYRQSQVDHLTGPEVLDAVLDRPEVQATKWYQGHAASPAEQLLDQAGLRALPPPRDRLAEALEAVAPRNKQHIFVSMAATTPGEPRLIVDAVVEEFVKFANRRNSDAELDRMQKLREEVRSREAELTRLTTIAAEYRDRLGTDTPSDVLKQRRLRLDELSAQLRTIRREYDAAVELEQTAASAVDATSQPADDQPPAAAALAAVDFEEDPEWQRRERELLAARQALANAPDTFGAEHPQMRRLQRAVEVAEEALAAREAELMGLGDGEGEDRLNPQLRRLAVERQLLEQEVAAEQAAYEAAFEDAEALRQLDSQLAALQEKLGTLRAELERIEMNREVAGTIRPWSAYEPTTPSNDRRMKMAAAALAGAFAAAVGLAFLRLKLNPTVGEEGEVATAATGGVLTRLPLARRGEMCSMQPSADVVESVRMLRTALLSRFENNHRLAIQITSASPRAGKSTVSALLAQSFASLGKRVLLVDADVRHPMLDQRFGLERAPGLLDVLSASADLQDSLRETAQPQLHVLPAGVSNRRDATELLANGRFSEMLAQWRAAYDAVILDTPPLVGPADAVILSREVDGSVLVVREKHCHRVDIGEAVGSLRRSGGRVLGTVFVGSDRGLGYGYGPAYRYGYTAGAMTDDNGATG